MTLSFPFCVMAHMALSRKAKVVDYLLADISFVSSLLLSLMIYTSYEFFKA